MRYLIIEFLVFALFMANVSSYSQKVARPDTISAGNSEMSEAEILAKRFAAEMETGRDIAPLIRKYFVKDFISRFENEHNGFPLAFFKPGIASQINEKDRLRYYISFITFYYLNVKYEFGKFDLNSDNEEHDARDLLPPGVYEILATNPRIFALTNETSDEDIKIKSEAELQAILPTMEKAAAAMRQYLKNHPPEQSIIYKKNISDLRKNNRFFKPWISICDKPCYGYSAGARLIKVNIPFLQLLLVKDHGSLKILSVAPYSN